MIGAELLSGHRPGLRVAPLEHGCRVSGPWPERDQALDGGGLLSAEAVELARLIRVDVAAIVEQAKAGELADHQVADVAYKRGDVLVP